jgi:hypothetical protein
VWIAWTTLSVHDLIEIAFTATELDEGQWEVAASLLSDGLTPAEAIMAAESVSLSPGK